MCTCMQHFCGTGETIIAAALWVRTAAPSPLASAHSLPSQAHACNTTLSKRLWGGLQKQAGVHGGHVPAPQPAHRRARPHARLHCHPRALVPRPGHALSPRGCHPPPVPGGSQPHCEGGHTRIVGRLRLTTCMSGAASEVSVGSGCSMSRLVGVEGTISRQGLHDEEA